MSDPDPEVRFREVQLPRQWWILLVVAVLSALAWYSWVEQILLGRPFGTKPAPDLVVWIVFLLVGLALPAFLLVARMVVTVDAEAVRILWIPFARKTIPLGSIVTADAVTYRPIRDYLGWGLKWMPGRGMAWSVSGNRGVLVRLEDGRRLLIGSGRAEDLERAIGRPGEA